MPDVFPPSDYRAAALARANAQIARAFQPGTDRDAARAFYRLARVVLDGLRERRAANAWCAHAGQMPRLAKADAMHSLALAALYRRKGYQARVRSQLSASVCRELSR